MKTKIFTFSLILFFLSSITAKSSQAEKNTLPNILIILVDDVGYGDPGFQSERGIPTPHIDDLANSSIRFTQGYIPAAYCAPSRAALMTGKHPVTIGHEFNSNIQQLGGLTHEYPTLAKRLEAQGYSSIAIGKWHLGKEPGNYPVRRGFNEFFGTLNNSSFYKPRMFMDTRVSDEVIPVNDDSLYTTTAYADRAVEWMMNKPSSPWFIYLAFNAQHVPIQVPDEYLEKFSHVPDHLERVYAACFSALDDAIGKVMNALEETGQANNTMVIFLSDNGGPTWQTEASNFPLRGFKGELWDGGTRVPFLIRWPSVLQGGGTYTYPVSSLDIMPTVMAATDLSYNNRLDGVNLLPYLKTEVLSRPHNTLYWRQNPQWAVRHGDWKLLIANGGSGKPELYDLATDPEESRDLAMLYPDKVKELLDLYDQWNEDQPEPDFEAGINENANPNFDLGWANKYRKHKIRTEWPAKGPRKEWPPKKTCIGKKIRETVE